MRRHVPLAIVATVCLSLCPAVASAQDDAFKRGLQARGDKNWSEVVRQMRRAIEADQQESTRKVRSNIVASVFGGGAVEYLPYYFLGEALKNQQDCAGAVTAWSASIDQKVVQSKPDFLQAIQRGFKECGARGVLLPTEFNAQLVSSRQAYVDASAMAKRIVDLGSTHKDIWGPLASQYDRAHTELETASSRLNAGMRTRSASDFNEVRAASERAIAVLKPLEESLKAAIDAVASVQQKIHDVEQAIIGADTLDKSIDSLKVALTEPQAASRKAGRDQLTQARDRLAAGQKAQNATTVNEAMKFAQGAAGAFNQVLDQLRRVARGALEQQLIEAVRGADEAFASVSALMATLERRVAQQPDKMTAGMATQREAMQKQIETHRRRFERVRKAEDLAGLVEVTKQTLATQAALDHFILAFGPITLRERGVHAALEDGVSLFLQGEYQKALVALDPSTGIGDASLQLHVHLFRAASLYQLFVRSAEKRTELRAQALEEIDKCKRLSSTFQPDGRVFPPPFIALYRFGSALVSSSPTAQ